MRSDWKCVEISTKSSQSALADLCWKQGLSRNFLHYEHVCIHAGVCVCVEIFLLSSRPPHFYKAHCRQYSSGTTASLELQAPGKPCADGLGLGMPPPPAPQRNQLCFAFHGQSRVFQDVVCGPPASGSPPGIFFSSTFLGPCLGLAK